MKNVALILILAIFTNCKQGKNEEYQLIGAVSDDGFELFQEHPGKRIMETECYICHDPKASQESMIAPPLITVKKYYIDENTTKKQFTEDLIRWVNDPEAKSKMPEALFEFGSMPYIPYPDEVIVQVADYIYENDIQRPDWYDDALKQSNGEKILLNRDIISKEILRKNTEIGMAHAMAAKKALSNKLIQAIGENGVAGAIEFCNTKALAITDSVSVMNNAIVRRVSDKPRNTKNGASIKEQGYITYFKKIVEAGKSPKPIVRRVDGEVQFYYPITTNAMCLQCHGQPNEQIQPLTMAKLESLYPQDKAVGYDVNEVRGMWSVNFEEKN